MGQTTNGRTITHEQLRGIVRLLGLEPLDTLQAGFNLTVEMLPWTVAVVTRQIRRDADGQPLLDADGEFSEVRSFSIAVVHADDAHTTTPRGD